MREMQRVKSEDIHSVGYDNFTLYVRFHSGKTYAYHGVSQSRYDALLAALSKGRYFNTFIRPYFKGIPV